MGVVQFLVQSRIFIQRAFHFALQPAVHRCRAVAIRAPIRRGLQMLDFRLSDSV